MPVYDVILKNVAPLRVVQACGVAPSMQHIGPTLDHLFDQLLEYISHHGAIPVGPGMAIYYDSEFCERNVSVGACLPFEGSLSDGEEVKVIELPAVETMASVIHHGSFSTIKQAYDTLLTWIESNGYHIGGPNRELSLEYERGGDQAQFVTEIQIPVEK